MDARISQEKPRESPSKPPKGSVNNPFELSDDDIDSPREPPKPIPDRGPGHIGKDSTMDPFEVRIRFTQHLQHLNASVTSANKAAQYALKHRDMDEDLHSCILEQLERVCHPFTFPLLDS